MAYKIRYGSDRYRHSLWRDVFRIQMVVSGALLLLTGLMRLVWKDGAAMAALLSSGPMTVGERAVAAFAGALADGKGWYHGLAVCCRTIIDAGML